MTNCVLSFSRHELAECRVGEVNAFWPTSVEGVFQGTALADGTHLYVATVLPFNIDGFLNHLKKVKWERVGGVQFWWKGPDQDVWQMVRIAECADVEYSIRFLPRESPRFPLPSAN